MIGGLHDDDRRDRLFGEKTGDELLERSFGRRSARDGRFEHDDGAASRQGQRGKSEGVVKLTRRLLLAASVLQRRRRP